MPSNHYAAFDRGFDLGHVDVPPTRSPVLARRLVSRGSRRLPTKMILAMAAVTLMIVTAFVVVQPAAPSGAPGEDNQAKAQAGEREVSYELSHFFESYLKNPDLTIQGNRTATPGLNDWWPARVSGYSELIVHDKFPFVTAYPLESGFTTPDVDPGFGLQTMARMHVVAKNLTSVGTDVGKDPIFIPIIKPSVGGGVVTLQWRSDVATGAEIAALKAVTSNYFGRTYYAAPRILLQNDGYWNLIYGHMTFDRLAAQTYLGLLGAGDLRTEFTNDNAGNAIGNLWMFDWLTETGTGGIYDIASAYEYSNDIRQLVLSLDPSSTADLLNIRIWSISWGNDMLLMRYLDVTGVLPNMQSYFEDMYLNATFGPQKGDIELSYYMQYAMLGWVDATTGKASWMLEAMSIDYVGSTAPPPAWQSRFNPYDPEKTNVMRTSRLPGTTMYGQQVSYYTSPMFWNLISGEKLTIKLPTTSAIGFEPYVGASNTLNAAKATELNSHIYWGELVLGHGDNTNLDSCYDHATKTVTLVGPTSFVRNPNPAADAINYSGVPEFVFDVAKVSNYDVKVLPVGGPYQLGVPYTVNVTARNITGSAVAWDGTVTLTSNTGAAFGASTHTYTNNAYWQTTVTFGALGTNDYVNATDTWFHLDVLGSAGPLAVIPIPEFGLLALPIVGAVALFAIFKRRRKSE